jgi:phosphopantetheinyl transferase (holo-ACP synthase)
LGLGDAFSNQSSRAHADGRLKGSQIVKKLKKVLTVLKAGRILAQTFALKDSNIKAACMHKKIIERTMVCANRRLNCQYTEDEWRAEESARRNENGEELLNLN